MMTRTTHRFVSSALLAAQAARQGVTIQTHDSGRDTLHACDGEQMTQVLLNLMLNGLQILTHGGQMQISTRDEPAQLVVEVADDGPGIAPEDRERLFEPFIRAEPGRERETGGVGLGLAIVKSVAEWHGGGARIGASPLGGARVSISW